MVDGGDLAPDPAQERVAARLQALHDALAGYTPETPAGGVLARLRRRKEAPRDGPRGIYIHGGVGRGKSMLMDLFLATAPVVARRRVHFHAFMLEVQKRLHARRKDHPKEPEPIRPLADALAAEAWLLCFDEFHVVDIADAMILGRLFEALLERGVVVVATSNWPPSRLYEGGLQRDLFLPFIAMLEARLDILSLDGDTDYRLQRLRDLDVYCHPLGAETDARLQADFARLTDGADPAHVTIPVNGRTLDVPRSANGVAWFTFEELCARPLGAADYLALTAAYHTLILSGVPRLTAEMRNEARRLMTLVDALYERRLMLIVGADAPPDALYPAGDGAFEFQRTASRLMEMQSRDYVESAAARERARPGVPFVPFALTSDLV